MRRALLVLVVITAFLAAQAARPGSAANRSPHRRRYRCARSRAFGPMSRWSKAARWCSRSATRRTRGGAFIADGQRVRIRARLCQVPGATGPKVVARRIAANGPIVPPQTAEDVLGADWRGNPGPLHDRTTRIAVLAVAADAAAALAFRIRRRPSPTARG
jgi:hypothetical protein